MKNPNLDPSELGNEGKRVFDTQTQFTDAQWEELTRSKHVIPLAYYNGQLYFFPDLDGINGVRKALADHLKIKENALMNLGLLNLLTTKMPYSIIIVAKRGSVPMLLEILQNALPPKYTPQSGIGITYIGER